MYVLCDVHICCFYLPMHQSTYICNIRMYLFDGEISAYTVLLGSYKQVARLPSFIHAICL